MQRGYLLVAAALLLLGCQQAPPPAGRSDAAPPTANPHVSAVAELKAEGDALMRVGNHRAALARYRRALDLDPEDVSLRFALGTAHTFLDQRSQAADQFKMVVARGAADSADVREARRWLAAARVPIESPSVPPAPVQASTPAPAPDTAITGGRLVGSTQWPGIDPKVRAVSGEIKITGIEAGTDGVTRSRPLRLGGRYHFYDIPPGKYRIVARMAHYPEDVTLWDETVSVADGKPTELALTPSTARVGPDKFPPPVQE